MTKSARRWRRYTSSGHHIGEVDHWRHGGQLAIVSLGIRVERRIKMSYLFQNDDATQQALSFVISQTSYIGRKFTKSNIQT
jgi:hypothetical protein